MKRNLLTLSILKKIYHCSSHRKDQCDTCLRFEAVNIDQETKAVNVNNKKVVCLFSERPRQQLGYIADWSQGGRLTSLRDATHETERGDHDFCLSQSHYTNTDPNSEERAATAGIAPRTSSPEVARSND